MRFKINDKHKSISGKLVQILANTNMNKSEIIRNDIGYL